MVVIVMVDSTFFVYGEYVQTPGDAEDEGNDAAGDYLDSCSVDMSIRFMPDIEGVRDILMSRC